jgi:hypothetical protein
MMLIAKYPVLYQMDGEFQIGPQKSTKRGWTDKIAKDGVKI